MISTVVGIAVVVVLSLGLLSGGAAILFVYLRRIIVSESTPRAGYEERLTRLELMVEGLPSLWEDERKRAKRLNDAAKAARKKSEEQLAEIEEITAGQAHIPGLDAQGSEEPEMRPLRLNMGVPAAPNRAEAVAAVAHLLR